MNRIYYSNKCKYSMELLELLKSLNITKYFQLICIDDIKNINIDYVPALILNGCNKIFYGSQIFNLIKFKTKLIGQKTNNMYMGDKLINNDDIYNNEKINNNDGIVNEFIFTNDNGDNIYDFSKYLIFDKIINQ